MHGIVSLCGQDLEYGPWLFWIKLYFIRMAKGLHRKLSLSSVWCMWNLILSSTKWRLSVNLLVIFLICSYNVYSNLYSPIYYSYANISEIFLATSITTFSLSVWWHCVELWKLCRVLIPMSLVLVLKCVKMMQFPHSKISYFSISGNNYNFKKSTSFVLRKN